MHLIDTQRMRAHLDLETGQSGGAALSALTALGLARSGRLRDSSRVLVRTLATVVQIACATGNVEVARQRAREALAVAQAALGPEDPDTAAAWRTLSAALEAAADLVGARAALKEAEAIAKRQTPPWC